MSFSIPLQLVDDEEFQALEVAISAAEFSASSSKKPKTSTSSNPCNLQADAAHLGLTLTDLSSSQAPNKLEILTEAITAAPCSTSLYGSEEKTCSRSPENMATDGAEYLQSELLSVHPIDCECSSFGGVSNDSTEETCFNSTKCLEVIQADVARFHKINAGHGCSDSCKGSNNVLLHPGHTGKLDPCSSHKAPSHEETLRNCVSYRDLPSWPHPSGGHNSRLSGHQEIRQTDRPRVDNEPASRLDLPNALCADNSRLPWGIVPHSRKVTPKCKLPSFRFKGQIVYSDTVLDAESAANELLRQVEAKKSANGGLVPLGFDTEWKTVFKRGAQRRKVAVLQLCIDADKCNVFHVIHSGIPSTLKSILEDPMVSKVGVGAYGDADKLCTDYNVKVKGLKDLSGLANLKMVGCANKNWSLSSLAEELLGKQVDKTASIRMGDWEVEKLSEAQLQYAATDAFASLYLFQLPALLIIPPVLRHSTLVTCAPSMNGMWS